MTAPDVEALARELFHAYSQGEATWESAWGNAAVHVLERYVPKALAAPFLLGERDALAREVMELRAERDGLRESLRGHLEKAHANVHWLRERQTAGTTASIYAEEARAELRAALDEIQGLRAKLAIATGYDRKLESANDELRTHLDARAAAGLPPSDATMRAELHLQLGDHGELLRRHTAQHASTMRKVDEQATELEDHGRLLADLVPRIEEGSRLIRELVERVVKLEGKG